MASSRRAHLVLLCAHKSAHLILLLEDELVVEKHLGKTRTAHGLIRWPQVQRGSYTHTPPVVGAARGEGFVRTLMNSTRFPA
jgi:hypothetical protein